MTPDFNRDGKMDLIVGSENTGNNSSPLYVLMSQGDGTFKASFLYNLAYGLVPDVAVADSLPVVASRATILCVGVIP